jgi:hypothetical protein
MVEIPREECVDPAIGGLARRREPMIQSLIAAVPLRRGLNFRRRPPRRFFCTRRS